MHLPGAVRHVGRGLYEPDHGQFDKAEEIFGACGGAALYRKAMLDQIGLFDEDFFAYHEDVDLAFRARLFGWKCMYVPVARVVHTHGGTFRIQFGSLHLLRNRNMVWYVVKNFPVKMLIACLPWILREKSRGYTILYDTGKIPDHIEIKEGYDSWY